MAVADVRPAGDLRAVVPGKNGVAVLPLKGSCPCVPLLSCLFVSWCVVMPGCR